MVRGDMKADTFKAEALLRLVIGPNERQAQFVKPVFDMLEDAGLIKIDGDTVSLENVTGLKEKLPPPPPLPEHEKPPPPADGLPILLGPNRIVYLRLPNDWDAKKDLMKLLKLLEISLGDGV